MRTHSAVFSIAIAAVFGLAVDAVRAADPQPAAQATNPAPMSYICPMHPQVRATFPGPCPICRMALKPAGAAPTGAASANHDHSGMNMGGMDMKMCPGCMMGMSGMSGRATSVGPSAAQKIAPADFRATGRRRCGC